MTDEKRLNPDIKEIEYGKKELKTLTIYPLSIGDQFKVTDIITDVIQKLAKEQTSDYVLMTTIIDSVKNNIGKILLLISDISKDNIDEIVDDLTNTQIVEIADIIWSVNFEPALKKGKSLFEKGKNVFNSKSLSQNSSSVIPNTDSKMSIEKSIKTED